MKFSSVVCVFGLLCSLPVLVPAQEVLPRTSNAELATASAPSFVDATASDLRQATALVPSAVPSAKAPATSPQTVSEKPAAGQTVPVTPVPAQTAPPIPAAGPALTPEEKFKLEERQRMLGVIPNFNTVNSDDATPLTKGEKFHLWFKSSTDPFVFVTAGLDAGLEQAENSYPGYHQGFVGYAKRYGASYADTVDGNFWGNAVLPVLLHQDPRYLRLGHGSFKYRLWWAALSTVRCKGDNGRWEPSYSNLGGNLIAGAISNVYYPSTDRGTGLIFERGLTVTAEGALGALAYEFYPDAIAYLKRRHQQHQQLRQ